MAAEPIHRRRSARVRPLVLPQRPRERLAVACAKGQARTWWRSRAIRSTAVWSERPMPPLGSVNAASARVRRRGRSRQDRADPRRDGAGTARRAGAVGLPCGGLDLQHPRRRRAHTPLPAVLRAGAEGRPPDHFHRRPQALPTASGIISSRVPTSVEPDALTTAANRVALNAAPRSASTAPPQPTP